VARGELAKAKTSEKAEKSVPAPVARGADLSYSWATEQKRGNPRTGTILMQPILANVAALAVASLFYLWRSHNEARQRRQRVLCQRVAYMLWVAAQNAEETGAPLAAAGRA
jgi:hypothetical protein